MFPNVFAANRRFPLLVVICSSLLQAMLAVAIAFSMRDVFAAFSLIHNDINDLPWKAIAVILCASVFIVFLRILEKCVAEHLSQLFVKELRIALYNQISRMPYEAISEHKIGSLQIRFIGDLTAIKNWIGIAIPSLIGAICLLPALLYLLYSLHPNLAIAGSIAAITSVVLMQVLSPQLRSAHQRLRENRGNLASFVSSRLEQANYLRILGLRKKITGQIKVRSDNVRSSAMNKAAFVNGFKSIPELSLQLLALGCLSSAMLLQMSAAEGAIILAILAIFQRPLQDLAGFWDKRHAYCISRKKCQQILNSKSMTAGKKQKIDANADLQLNVAQITQRSIPFPAFTCSSGDVVQISGGSATGKSSFLHMLVGLSLPEKGRIEFNGLTANQLNEYIRNQTIYFQGSNIAVFNSTLRSSLILGISHKVSEERIYASIRKAGINETIEKIGGIDAKVKENGKNLSTTDINRIGLCRLLLTRAPFVFVDDISRFEDLADFDLVEELMSNRKRILVYSNTDDSAALSLKVKRLNK